MFGRRALVIVMLLVVAACGDDDAGGSADPATTTTVATTTTTPGGSDATTTSTTAATTTTEASGGNPSPIVTDTVLAYFEAFALNDEGREEMLDHALEGSAAHAYATYWWTVWVAAGPAGSFEQVIDASEPGEIAACVPDGQGNSSDSGCISYTDFVVDPETGLLVDFEEAGKPMSESVALGDGTIDAADGISIRIVVAKQIDSARISIVWENTNDTGTVSEAQVRMVSAGGDIIQPDAWTQNDVPASGSTLNAANFTVSGLGGTLQYRITSTESVIEVPIPIP